MGHKAPRQGHFIESGVLAEDSRIWSSTLAGYRVLWLCHRRLTPRHRQLVANASSSKWVHHLKSPTEMKAFLQAVKLEHQRI
jgi:hypothetical protein